MGVSSRIARLIGYDGGMKLKLQFRLWHIFALTAASPRNSARIPDNNILWAISVFFTCGPGGTGLLAGAFQRQLIRAGRRDGQAIQTVKI